MRAISFILAFALVLATNSMAGSVDTLPGVGTFAFQQSAPTSMMVAAR